MNAKPRTKAKPRTRKLAADANKADTSKRSEESIEQRVYAIIRKVPRGCVVTYGQVAMLAAIPRNSRQVARLLRFCDPKDRLPWYRVLGKHSPRCAHISVPEPEHAKQQRRHLEREGVRFTPAGTVRLDEYGWLPLE